MRADTLTTLATLVGARLKAKGLMLATAESCTGGWVAQAVTAIAGSSDWFERGFVTYSNAAKMEMLRVKAGTLRTHGAVSEQTAGEMAAGAIARSRAQVAVAVTGIAGPGGGSAEKPVGTVFIALATSKKTFVEKHILTFDRATFKYVAAQTALNMLRKALRKS